MAYSPTPSPTPRSGGIWQPLAFAGVLALGLLLGYRFQNDAPLLSIGTEAGAHAGGERVSELLNFIEAKYVDEVDGEKLTDRAIRAVLEELDPHSNYISPEELAAINEQMEGNFEGIGIEYLVVEDTITVVTALSGGPSALAGLLPGDQIVAVGDSVVTGVFENEIDPASLMRGEGGTDVTVSVRRPTDPDPDELRTFVITRAAIPVYSLDAGYKLDENTAYLKINRFSATTYDEFITAIKETMEQGGAVNLILDLRGNPGGYLQMATRMLSQLFLAEDLTLVYTKGRNTSEQYYRTSGRAIFDIQKIAILVDGGSASASEIVAGAIQDHDRGIVVGRRTFGKGLVQEQYPLSNGGALRLTVARYYTPSGRSIQRSYDEGAGAYHDDLGSRYASGELTGATTAEVDTSQSFYTDNGHLVYGGGGIMPDYFVPLDSTLNSEGYAWLRQQIPAYVFRYVREQQRQLDRYDGAEEFARSFRPNMTRVLPELRQMAVSDYDQPIPELLPNQRRELERFLSARVARQLYGPEAYYVVYNREDEVVRAALDLINDSETLAAARRERPAPAGVEN